MPRSERFTYDVRIVTPNWAALDIQARDLIPGGAKLEPGAFLAVEALTVTTSGAAAGAEEIPLSAPIPEKKGIPYGTIIGFGAVFVALQYEAQPGEQVLKVAKTTAAIAPGATATYYGTQRIRVESATAVGRSFADRDAGRGFVPAIGTEDEFYLTAFEVVDALDNNDVSLLRHQFLIYENCLPFWDTATESLKTKVRSLYQCTKR